MRIGHVFFEAKLTEADFTIRPRFHVHRYTGLETILDVARLPATSTHFESYQLIRNVLAAAQHYSAFVLLIDRRRPDLLQKWNAVSAAIIDSALAQRCTARTWQEVAAHAPASLARFLDAKYGL